MTSSEQNLAVAAAGLAVFLSAAAAADMSGAGATFPSPIYAKWAEAYKAETGVGLNYQSIGSGGGIQQIKARTVTFGASDMPLTTKALDAAELFQFPTVSGGIVPIYNLPSVPAGKLVLDGPTLTNIFLGHVTQWNDPAIRRLNPGLDLPDQAIVVVHRSDGSGTTFAFTTYLARVSAEWKAEVGANSSVDWPVGIGPKGSEGPAGTVAQTPGSIGYVEYAYALQSHLRWARMVNRDGKTVEPSLQSVGTAVAHVDWAGAAENGFYVIPVDQPGARSWPIVSTTFILLYKHPDDPSASANVRRFFRWAFAHGQDMAQHYVYAPLPHDAVRAIERNWDVVEDGCEDCGR
jgi:phosphate transport system substrate-binding protein